jgi:toxin ParE1/3/4
VKVRYTRRSLRQLAEILDYLDAHSPQGADNVKRRLQAVVDLLADHPNSGRLTRKDGIRRAVARPCPYVISTGPTRLGLSSTGSGMLPADRFSTVDFWAYVAVSVSGGGDRDADRQAVRA